jgi:hypothetical protein
VLDDLGRETMTAVAERSHADILADAPLAPGPVSVNSATFGAVALLLPLRRGRPGLGEEPADPRQLKALLAPYPSEEMTCWPVSARVGNVKNNDLTLIEPLALQ